MGSWPPLPGPAKSGTPWERMQAELATADGEVADPPALGRAAGHLFGLRMIADGMRRGSPDNEQAAGHALLRIAQEACTNATSNQPRTGVDGLYTSYACGH